MTVLSVTTQLRTTDLAQSIRFYTGTLGLVLEFQHEDFYAGIRAGTQVFHLKLVDDRDPSIDYVEHHGHFHLYIEVDDAKAAADSLIRKGLQFEQPLTDTAWGTREFVIKDDQGHTLYLAERVERAR